MSRLRISAKNLGMLALADFCPRCFWFRVNAENRLPYQVFPGIFSSIDSYTKRVVHAWIDRHRSAPIWLDGIGEVNGYIDPPHHSRFQMEIPRYDILLTGSPDGVLTLSDLSIAIVDYKTARYTATQDKLMPMYMTQLNGYAQIAGYIGLGNVTKLALVYAEPVTDEKTASDPAVQHSQGFSMRFAVHVHPVEIDPAMIQPLLATARAIFERSEPPAGREGCQDCRNLDRLISLAKGGAEPAWEE